MEKLQLTQKEANTLIKLFKVFASRKKIDLLDNPEGKINLIDGKTKHPFNLYYKFALDNHHITLNDAETNLTLVRINLDSGFHKNSTGRPIRGHRVEIFDENEFYQKNDGFTHYKAFNLPYDCIEDTDDFLESLFYFFEYANIQKNGVKLFKKEEQLKLDV